ncbi:hypothetical protein [Dyella japonica]|nr:hypothetical protein [Dyella japonica]
MTRVPATREDWKEFAKFLAKVDLLAIGALVVIVAVFACFQ